MKKFIRTTFLVIIIVACCLLTSCNHGASDESTELRTFGKFTIVYSYQAYDVNDNLRHMYYMYDNDTKIMYYANFSDGVSMCPMYDKDGNIYTYDEWHKDNFIR